MHFCVDIWLVKWRVADRDGLSCLSTVGCLYSGIEIQWFFLMNQFIKMGHFNSSNSKMIKPWLRSSALQLKKKITQKNMLKTCLLKTDMFKVSAARRLAPVADMVRRCWGLVTSSWLHQWHPEKWQLWLESVEKQKSERLKNFDRFLQHSHLPDRTDAKASLQPISSFNAGLITVSQVYFLFIKAVVSLSGATDLIIAVFCHIVNSTACCMRVQQ